MATFFMFGSYSHEALKGVSAARTKKAVSLIEKLGGKVLAMYALLGKYDLVLITEFPALESAVKCSVELNKLTGIAFSTQPALALEEFDRLAAK